MKSEVTSKEAAELLEVSESRVRQFILANRVRSRKVGNTRLIKRVDIDKIIESRSTQNQGRKAA
jgi:excisionase family DNA binding protein